MDHLISGNLNYSSWSLRGWLAVRATGKDFRCDIVPLFSHGYAAKLREHSPAAKVPILKTGGITVHDSLAICETIAERHPELWPADAAQRALARAVSAEMHSGFLALRSAMPMNLRAEGRQIAHSDELVDDIKRIDQIWNSCRAAEPDGQFLFGAWSIADIMYAPVVARFTTYGVEVSAPSEAYMNAVYNHPHMIEALELGRNESWVIDQAEVG